MNFSNNENNIYYIKTRSFVSILVLITFQGCYSYQPPAPIYGEPKATNPYKVLPTAKTFPLRPKQKSDKQTVPSDVSSKNSIPDFTPQKKPLSPAVLALISEADQNAKAGDLESAVATIERALRIDPRNPSLTYKLASIRLKQSKPRLAEDLAKKAALLSANDKVLKKKSWLLISEARKRQKNYFGAKEAKLKADRM